MVGWAGEARNGGRAIKMAGSSGYDVVVVGAGHAGVEAALAAARLGCRVLVATLKKESIALMPCNPSIGGPGKAQLVREIDALGGEMGLAADDTYVQIRVLNTSKGPAVRALRAQIDKAAYQARMRRVLETAANIEIVEGEVSALVLRENRVSGVVIGRGGQADEIPCRAAVVTTGTYMRGLIHVGSDAREGGPQGLPASVGLAAYLQAMGVVMRRFKTGTSPRVARDSVDFSGMIRQPGEDVGTGFSFISELRVPAEKQLPVWQTLTSASTRRIIEENLHLAPLFTGEIVGVGPRYCPSIETKVVQFHDRISHQVFVEPQGWSNDELYLAGLSTSLPAEVQEMMVHSVPGLEQARIARYGYAIEYDCLDPLQLRRTLEFKGVSGLFFAGQVNGTSGYEEAAAQGLIAGINAGLLVKGEEALVLERSESYIGVVIDDLVTRGTEEPYRILTSRAEYRLLLREDNADMRLTEKGLRVGSVSPERMEVFRRKKAAVEVGIAVLEKTMVPPTSAVNGVLARRGVPPLARAYRLGELVRRPEVGLEAAEELLGLANDGPRENDGPRAPGAPEGTEAGRLTEAMMREFAGIEGRLAEKAFAQAYQQVEEEVKYHGYIERQKQQVERLRRMEDTRLPADLDYAAMEGISREGREKLERVQPESLGQAVRIAGVSPADIAVLSVYLEQRRRSASQDGGPRGYGGSEADETAWRNRRGGQ